MDRTLCIVDRTWVGPDGKISRSRVKTSQRKDLYAVQREKCDTGNTMSEMRLPKSPAEEQGEEGLKVTEPGFPVIFRKIKFSFFANQVSAVLNFIVRQKGVQFSEYVHLMQ